MGRGTSRTVAGKGTSKRGLQRQGAPARGAGDHGGGARHDMTRLHDAQSVQAGNVTSHVRDASSPACVSSTLS